MVGPSEPVYRNWLQTPLCCIGYSEGELLQLGIADLHPKHSLGCVVSEFHAQMSGIKSLSSALPCLRKDGTILYADIGGSSTVFQGRRCGVGFFADVTARKLAEEKLHKRAGKSSE